MIRDISRTVAYIIRESVSGNYYTMTADTQYKNPEYDLPITLGSNRRPDVQFDMYDSSTDEYWTYWVVARIETEYPVEDLPIITPHPVITEDI